MVITSCTVYLILCGSLNSIPQGDKQWLSAVQQLMVLMPVLTLLRRKQMRGRAVRVLRLVRPAEQVKKLVNPFRTDIPDGQVPTVLTA